MSSSINPPLKANNFSPSPFRGMPIGDVERMCYYFNDFMINQDYAATDWVVTEQGTATQIMAPQEANGALVLTNAAADNDSAELQQSNGGSTVIESWTIETGRRVGMACRFKVDDADAVDFIIGLCITDTTLVDGMTDGIYFRIVDGAVDVTGVTEKGSTETVVTGLSTAADDTYVEVGFHFDGAGTVTWFKRSPVTGDEDEWVVIGTSITNLPDDEELAISIAHQNGDASAGVATIDYIKVVQDRT